MNYKEVDENLFSNIQSYYLVHCISADFALGKGIAVEFNKKFEMKKKLHLQYPNYLKSWQINKKKFDCLLIDNVFNLVTKEKYFNKPTYKSIKGSLELMKDICIQKKIQKIAMPTIGCGLDRLKWDKISQLIKTIFRDTDIEILVCIPSKSK